MLCGTADARSRVLASLCSRYRFAGLILCHASSRDLQASRSGKSHRAGNAGPTEEHRCSTYTETSLDSEAATAIAAEAADATAGALASV